MKIKPNDWKRLLEALAQGSAWQDLLTQAPFDQLPIEERELLYRLGEQGHLPEAIQRLQQLDTDRSWDQLEQHIAPTRQKWSWISRAAIWLLPLGLSGLLYKAIDPPAAPNRPPEQQVAAPLDRNKATLRLANGQEINLTKNSSFAEIIQANKSYSNALDQNSANQIKQLPTQYNELRVPRGGEYSLTLVDGTHVTLNAESRLRFPASFEQATMREVFLEQGEAYFEVKKTNDKQPFVVHVDDMDVRVLGTSFNVNRYDKTYKTTLVEGHVALQVSKTGQTIHLTPGQQGNFQPQNAQLHKLTADLDQALAWRSGLFIFDGEPLQQVMEQVGRWYNLDIHFESEKLKQIHFGGKLQHYERVDKLLPFIEQVGNIRLEQKDGTIYIRKRTEIN
ncbi:hypothetical protein BWD42_07365 [Sphingobacterium sp. CZ-UAM]|uniref:FecR family protein n=1 Tax=Sphingobacterium sp. CZ-UAM TaxID=1933868 RepID=UPI00098737F0|nr:FecR domain-containing protein [Sphingobacterium sp. CZ-UAM]OOG19713.1 hypothetical protein BWD42_07365 [Sphingobacterium sp. CZ-UAM]